MKILVCGDLHLDATTAGLPRFDDVARSLRAAADLAVKEQCDGFVQLGDLCDPGPQASRCAALAIEVSASLNGTGLWVRWLVGNHDVVEDGAGASTLAPVAAYGRSLGEFGPSSLKSCALWSEPTIEWVRIFGRTMTDNVAMVALPHPARGLGYVPAEYVRMINPAATAEARVVLVFGHLTVPGMQPGGETLELPRGREVLFPVGECVARWGDRVVMVNGHYHRASRRADGPVIIPGSVERLTRGEARNEPGVFVLEV